MSFSWVKYASRGGVEDTMLEAKDTKKNPRPRTALPRTNLSKPRTGMLEAKTKDQGHKRKCSPKKRSSKNFFRRSPVKNIFQNFFQAIYKILTIKKKVLSCSREQGTFRGLEASRPRTWPSRPRTSKCVLEDSTSDGKNSLWRFLWRVMRVPGWSIFFLRVLKL